MLSTGQAFILGENIRFFLSKIGLPALIRSLLRSICVTGYASRVTVNDTKKDRKTRGRTVFPFISQQVWPKRGSVGLTLTCKESCFCPVLVVGPSLLAVFVVSLEGRRGKARDRRTIGQLGGFLSGWLSLCLREKLKKLRSLTDGLHYTVVVVKVQLEPLAFYLQASRHSLAIGLGNYPGTVIVVITGVQAGMVWPSAHLPMGPCSSHGLHPAPNTQRGGSQPRGGEPARSPLLLAQA